MPARKRITTLARRLAGAAVLGLAGGLAYLCLWPVPAEPMSWPAPTPPGYTGAHAPNSRLSGLRTIDIGSEFGPEHIAIGPDSKLYAAMTSGSLLRMDPDGSHQQVFANTGGRVLGFAFDAAGQMIAARPGRNRIAAAQDQALSLDLDTAVGPHPGVELLDQRGDMEFGGVAGDAQTPGYCLVGGALGEQSQHLQLARRESGERLGRARRDRLRARWRCRA